MGVLRQAVCVGRIITGQFAAVASFLQAHTGGCLPRLQATNTNETVGTFAIAYAAHKALSPVRFPPTVALTPVVARWLGKDKGPAAGSADSGSADPGSSGNSK